ncbi:MAG: transglutaminase family protein, partial [Bacteroidota bacterium]
PFEMDWLAPFCEFRFPILGQLQLEDVHLEIRAGIEAWNVLGEEMSQSGTARFVDSSVERIQIKVSGIKTERYQLLCNQTVVPLSFTGTNGQYVAGIRYKAWNPPSALHPTVGVDVPLVFDLYDSWNERSIGGCTYHVAHPGGRNYDTFPVNSYEAEARRANRFQEFNHSPRRQENILNQVSTESGTLRYLSDQYHPTVFAEPPLILPQDPEYPHTLDLRKKGKSVPQSGNLNILGEE